MDTPIEKTTKDLIKELNQDSPLVKVIKSQQEDIKVLAEGVRLTLEMLKDKE